MYLLLALSTVDLIVALCYKLSVLISGIGK